MTAKQEYSRCWGSSVGLDLGAEQWPSTLYISSLILGGRNLHPDLHVAGMEAQAGAKVVTEWDGGQLGFESGSDGTTPPPRHRSPCLLPWHLTAHLHTERCG